MSAAASLPDDLTVMILTFNEEANIARTLAGVGWARRILVVDSGSTDATLTLLAGYPQVTVRTRAFDDFASQCNYGLSQIETAWVLSLDADYELSTALGTEICSLRPTAAIAGYSAAFVYRVHGRALRGSLYPPRTVLYRRDGARYRNEGHGHRIERDGQIRSLREPIYHDDRKPLSRWFQSQRGYAAREAAHLLAADRTDLRRRDRIRLMAWPAPLLVLGYTLLVKGCLLDGWAGWYYALQRALAEIMIALEIIERRRHTASDNG